MITKELILKVIRALNGASSDYRAFSQQQAEKGEPYNAADYHKRSEECHDMARQLDNIGSALP
jgi:hypothetical protein